MESEMTETKKRDWGWLGYVGTALLGAAVAVIIMLSCGKKPPIPASVIDAIIHVAFLHYPPREPADIVLPLTGDSTYTGQILEIHKLDTVPDTLHVYTGIMQGRLTPAQSWLWYYDSLNYYTASKLTAPLDFNWDVVFGLDTTGKPHIAYTKLPQYTPPIRRTLAVCLSGGAQYGQVDTLYQVRPEFETSLKWNITSWLYAKAGLRFPWGAFLTLTGDIPLITKEK